MSLLLKHHDLLIINTKLAVSIGLNDAVVLQQLAYWLEETSAGFEHQGARYIYNTYEQWKLQFPFWSVDTIKRSFTSLKKAGLIVTKQLSPDKRDNTNYYTINYEAVDNLGRGNLPLPPMQPSNDDLAGANCPDGAGQIAPMEQGKLPQSLDTLTTALNSPLTTHTEKPKSSKSCAVKDAQTKTVCVDLQKLPKAQKTEQPSPVNTPKPPAPLEVTLENLATVLKASGIEASAAMQADAISITLTKGKALDYAVGTVRRKLASGEAAPATFAPANSLTTPSVQPVYKHPEVTVASKAVREAALAALTVKLATTAPVAAPDAGNTAFTPLVGEFKWAVDIITQKRQEFTNKVLTSKIGNRAFTNACEVLRVNKKTLNQE